MKGDGKMGHFMVRGLSLYLKVECMMVGSRKGDFMVKGL